MRSTIRSLVWRHSSRAGLALVVILLVAVAYLAYSWAQPRPESLKDLELLTRIAAFSAGTLFIIYRVFSGFFVANLEVTLVARRIPDVIGDDHLLVDVVACKGAHGTLGLRYARSRVLQRRSDSWIQLDSGPLEATDRVRTDKLLVDEWLNSDDRPELRLAPGDRMEFAAHFRVPRDAVCRIDVVIAGKTLVYLRSGQWRATTFSVPSGSLMARRRLTQG